MGASSDTRSAQSAVATMGTVTILLAGGLTLTATGALLIADDPGPIPWVVFLAATLAWLVGLLLRRRRFGALTSTLALLAVYASAAFLPEPNAWLSFGIASTAIMISAAMALPTRMAIPVMAVAFAFMSWYAYSPPPGEPVDLHLPVIGGWAAPLFNLTVAIGLTLWRAEWARAAVDSDDALVQAEVAVSETQRDAASSEARVLVARSLHETVLNTLGAISLGTSPERVDELRRICRTDLERASSEAAQDAMRVRPAAQPLPWPLTVGTPIIDIFTGQRRLRIAATTTAIFGIGTVGIVAQGLPSAAAFILVYIAFTSVIAALVWWWRNRLLLACAAFTLLAVLALITGMTEADAESTHEVGHALDWVINVGATSMILATLVISRSPILRIVFPWSLLAANIVAITFVPADERIGPITSLVATTLYLGGVAYSGIWLFGRIDAQRWRAARLMDEASREEYERVHRAELLMAWAAVSRATRDLLAGISSGRLDPADPAIQRKALVEATVLRSRLRLARNPSSGIQASLEMLLDRASSLGCALDARIIMPSTRPERLPHEVEQAITELLANAGDQAVEIRLIGASNGAHDELVITGPKPAALALAQTLQDCEMDCVVELEGAGDGFARLSLTCHEFAMAQSFTV